ncbi:hypothetical protein HYE69_02450 [Staphylococcus sp. GSSP0090]|nr:hypothetical protein [Staphylococcus sp. GSSP0090]
MDKIIKEYDNSNNLIYIADFVTGKGYKVKNEVKKNSDTELELEKHIKKIRGDKRRQNNFFGILVNKLLNFKKSLDDMKLFKCLGWLYILLLIVLIYQFTSNNYILNSLLSIQNNYSSWEFILGIFLFFIGVICIHEFSHILIARMSNILVLKLGAKFKYYIFPIIYVKAMPTSFRMKKVNIAFAGLIADLLIINIYIFLYLTLENYFFLIALKFHFLLFIFNYNILLPTDFTQAFLNLIHKEKFRDTAFKNFKTLVLNSNSDINVNKTQKYIYVLYSLLFVVFWLFILMNIILTFINALS